MFVWVRNAVFFIFTWLHFISGYDITNHQRENVKEWCLKNEWYAGFRLLTVPWKQIIYISWSEKTNHIYIDPLSKWPSLGPYSFYKTTQLLFLETVNTWFYTRNNAFGCVKLYDLFLFSKVAPCTIMWMLMQSYDHASASISQDIQETLKPARITMS